MFLYILLCRNYARNLAKCTDKGFANEARDRKVRWALFNFSTCNRKLSRAEIIKCLSNVCDYAGRKRMKTWLEIKSLRTLTIDRLLRVKAKVMHSVFAMREINLAKLGPYPTTNYLHTQISFQGEYHSGKRTL